VYNEFKQLPPEQNVMRIQISSVLNQHQKKRSDFIHYIVCAEDDIRVGFMDRVMELMQIITTIP
jgi:hypothetical protein